MWKSMLIYCRPFGEKFIAYIVTCINTCDFTVLGPIFPSFYLVFFSLSMRNLLSIFYLLLRGGLTSKDGVWHIKPFSHEEIKIIWPMRRGKSVFPTFAWPNYTLLLKSYLHNACFTGSWIPVSLVDVSFWPNDRSHWVVIWGRFWSKEFLSSRRTLLL